MTAITSRTVRWSPPVVALALFAICGVGLGWLAARSPLMSVGTAAAVVLIGSAPKARTLLGAGLLLLAVYPARIFPSSVLANPELHKGALLLALAPVVLRRGFYLVCLAPVGAYVVLAGTSTILGSPISGLTPVQTASSLLTLSTGWLFLAVRWKRGDVAFLLLVLASVPTFSILAGFVFQFGGLAPVVTTGQATRLAGASIAALLGGVAAAGAAAALVGSRVATRRNRLYGLLAAVNVLIAVGTLTRGALLAVAIMSVPFAAEALRGQLRGSAAPAILRVGFSLVAIAAVLSVAIPAVQSRGNEVRWDPVTRTLQNDATSGRGEAWSTFYKIAEENIVFGRGLGAGPTVQLAQPGFTAQHNEYLRSILETGYFGLIVTLASMVAACRFLLARAGSRFLRGAAKAQIGALAVYAITDNALTSQFISIPFLLLFALTCAAGELQEKQPNG